MNIERKCKLECQAVDCKYYELHCLVYHGNNCIRLGGTKIPLQRSLNGLRGNSKPPAVTKWSLKDILRQEG